MLSKKQAQDLLWREGDLRFLLWSQQMPIYNNIRKLPIEVQIAVMLVSRQYGKSHLGCMLAVEDAIRTPNILVVVIAPSLIQCKAIVRPRMNKIIAAAPKGMIEFKKSENVYLFDNGSAIQLSGYDSNISQRGQTIHTCYLEELCDSNPEEYLEFIRSQLIPAMAHSEKPRIYFLTTPPPTEDHPFMTHTVAEARRQGSLYVYTIDDNKKLSKKRKAELIEGTGGIDSPQTQREWFCNIVRDANVLLVPEFKEAIHVQDFDLPKFRTFWVGGDVGGTADRTAIFLMSYDPEADKILVLDEVDLPYTTTDADIAREGLAMERRWNVPPNIQRFIDCFGQTRINFSQLYGWFTSYPRCKSKDNTIAGVYDVRVAFHNEKILVNPRCKKLIKVLRSGQWNKQRTDFMRTEDFGHCDALAALVYGVRNAVKKDATPRMHNLSHDTHIIPGLREEQNIHQLGKLLGGYDD